MTEMTIVMMGFMAVTFRIIHQIAGKSLQPVAIRQNRSHRTGMRLSGERGWRGPASIELIVTGNRSGTKG